MTAHWAEYDEAPAPAIPGAIVSLIEELIADVRRQQLNHNDPRSLALVITHLEDALLRYQYANR
jgi:hypothetical protein